MYSLLSCARLLWWISDKLDGLLHKKADTLRNMEDFLSLPDDYERKAKDGKKHVSIISMQQQPVVMWDLVWCAIENQANCNETLLLPSFWKYKLVCYFCAAHSLNYRDDYVYRISNAKKYNHTVSDAKDVNSIEVTIMIEYHTYWCWDVGCS